MIPFYTNPKFISNLKPFIDENIVRIYQEPYLPEDEEKGGISPGDPNLPFGKFFENNFKKFFKVVTTEESIDEDGSRIIKFDGEIITEAEIILKEMFKGDDRNSFTFLMLYYGQLLSALIRNINDGKKCLTTSKLTSDLLKEFYLQDSVKKIKRKIETELKVTPSIAFESVKLAVPNLSNLSCQEIIEIRYKAKDELITFKEYLQSLQFDLENNFDPEYIEIRSKEIVNSKIKPALKDLTRKFESLKSNIPSIILDELKDPKSYSPLLLTLTKDISDTLVLSISLGLIGLNAAIKLYRERQALKKNGMYYLLYLKNKTFTNKKLKRK